MTSRLAMFDVMITAGDEAYVYDILPYVQGCAIGKLLLAHETFECLGTFPGTTKQTMPSHDRMQAEISSSGLEF